MRGVRWPILADHVDRGERDCLQASKERLCARCSSCGDNPNSNTTIQTLCQVHMHTPWPLDGNRSPRRLLQPKHVWCRTILLLSSHCSLSISRGRARIFVGHKCSKKRKPTSEPQDEAWISQRRSPVSERERESMTECIKKKERRFRSYILGGSGIGGGGRVANFFGVLSTLRVGNEVGPAKTVRVEM